ncbi:hypothetical protein [Rhizobium sp. LjRoot258]|uniref:hypothetical protein n=1 Tax=Rhizobium sp. LjRoot258 TaxID=3342299 RepID=UPI003ECD82A5
MTNDIANSRRFQSFKGLGHHPRIYLPEWERHVVDQITIARFAALQLPIDLRVDLQARLTCGFGSGGETTAFDDAEDRPCLIAMYLDAQPQLNEFAGRRLSTSPALP